MEKNIISRESCKKDLLHLVKADMLSQLILLGVVSVIFVPLMLIGIYLLKYIIVLGIATILVCALPIAYFIYRFIKNVIAFQMVKNDGFSIVKDTVCRLSRGEPDGKDHTADVIYFTNHGRFISGRSVFDLTSLSDEFYLVVLNDKKREIKFAYHSIMNDCKELDKAI